MLVYNPPERISSDQGGSISKQIAYMQRLLVSSKIATAYTWIPCALLDVWHILVAAKKLSTTSANGVALGTTTVVAEYDSEGAVTNLDAHGASVAYVLGNLVKATPTGGVEAAYICVVAHTSTAGPDFDADIANWQLLSETKFLKLTHTSPGTGKHTHLMIELHGTF